MLRKALAAVTLAGSLTAAGVAVPAFAQTSSPAPKAKAPKCIAAVERKAALQAEVAATNARIVALNAAKAQATGHPRAIERITVRLARAQGHLTVVQTRLTNLTTRCP